MNETYEQQMRDSNNIFTAIIHGNFETFEQAQQAIVAFWIPDMNVSRSGISHAIKRLERHYKDKSA